MIEKISYYMKLLSELCGYDGSSGNATVGWIIVFLSTVLVIWTFYFWITRSIWPGEGDSNHVKRRILLDDETSNAN